MRTHVSFILGIVLFNGFLTADTLKLDPQHDLVSELKEHQLITQDEPLRLHLGCGENRFPGYVNIDFPPSEHSVQKVQGADAFADITRMRAKPLSLDEVRNHHVFEHFQRPIALALLCAWHDWLKVGGKLHVETPDLESSLRLLTNPKTSYADKQIIIRHLFGSHEASWAVHCDGWYKEKFQHILQELGFGKFHFKKLGSKPIKNVAVIAVKETELSREELREKAKLLLKENLVNESEHPLWVVWCDMFDQAFDQLILETSSE
ncbi:MAG: hypothetical protein JSR93_01910 [Verrucomicrobia bacterium]|nr:hypothetical protein [Verrucomicrobiota bacterium]